MADHHTYKATHDHGSPFPGTTKRKYVEKHETPYPVIKNKPMKKMCVGRSNPAEAVIQHIDCPLTIRMTAGSS